jgi:transcriptional regulator with PAS, ATPase and Fis domain
MTQALHQASHRRDKPLHTINCAALPWPALDLQLFGEDGQSGLFAEAKGGTLFLDEIGDLSESLQAKLLQVLAEYGQGTPEVRVISSSHQDLVTAMEEGRFREDLFYRLNVANITLPPLSARSEDIPCWPVRRWTITATVTPIAPPSASRRRRWPCWPPRPGRATCASSAGWWSSSPASAAAR